VDLSTGSVHETSSARTRSLDTVEWHLILIFGAPLQISIQLGRGGRWQRLTRPAVVWKLSIQRPSFLFASAVSWLQQQADKSSAGEPRALVPAPSSAPVARTKNHKLVVWMEYPVRGRIICRFWHRCRGAEVVDYKFGRNSSVMWRCCCNLRAVLPAYA